MHDRLKKKQKHKKTGVLCTFGVPVLLIPHHLTSLPPPDVKDALQYILVLCSSKESPK